MAFVDVVAGLERAASSLSARSVADSREDRTPDFMPERSSSEARGTA